MQQQHAVQVVAVSDGGVDDAALAGWPFRSGARAFGVGVAMVGDPVGNDTAADTLNYPVSRLYRSHRLRSCCRW